MSKFNECCSCATIIVEDYDVGEQGLFCFNPVNRYTGFLFLYAGVLGVGTHGMFRLGSGWVGKAKMSRAHPGSLGLFHDWGSHSWERS